ncbi:hypothetical protein D9M72_443080 [compost metagenome]
MRFPSEEDDRRAILFGAGHLRQHALFGGFDHLEALEAEGVLVDHVDDQAVAVIARFDAIDLAFERVFLGGDILEVLDAEFGTLGVGRQRVFRAFEVRAEGFDRLVVEIGANVVFLGRHPVAEEDVDVLVLERGVGDRNRENLDVGLVAEALEDGGNGRGGCSDVRPTDVGETDGTTAFRLGSCSLSSGEGDDRNGARQHQFERESFFHRCRSPASIIVLAKHHWIANSSALMSKEVYCVNMLRGCTMRR